MIARKQLQALILSNELSFETLIVEMMSEINWGCEIVTSGRDALTRLKTMPFDAVITDYKLAELPQGNGLHFISILRRENITLPAIVMSENEAVLRTVPKDQLNIAAILLKPFSVSDLRSALDAVCVA